MKPRAPQISWRLILPPSNFFRLALAIVAAMVLMLGALAIATIANAGAVQVTVTIDPFTPGKPVPGRFLGLSFEMAALHQIAQYADHGDLVELLRSLGPGMLRFGGITADENVAWTDANTPKPAWASSTIDAADLRALGNIARRSGWQVLLTVGMAHYEPTAAAHEVAAAHKALGPYLAAIEIGNEPNAYGAHGFRQLPWIAEGYEEEVSNYREAINALTPNVPIAGPDVSGSGAFSEWGEEEALSQKPMLLTGHHYPLGCAQTPAPSIEALLSPSTRGREANSLATYLKVANEYSIPLRVDETNTVSCGGVAGISNTFASTLWASAYITQAMAAGAAGINLQGNPGNCAGYTPLCAPNPADLAEGEAARRARVVRAPAKQIARRQPPAAHNNLSQKLTQPRRSRVLKAQPLPASGTRQRRTTKHKSARAAARYGGQHQHSTHHAPDRTLAKLHQRSAAGCSRGRCQRFLEHSHPNRKPCHPLRDSCAQATAKQRRTRHHRTCKVHIMTLVRYVLPAAVVVGGIIVMILGSENDLEGGAGIISAGLAIYFLNWLFRIGVSGERERDEEDAARDYFEQHGRWPN